MLEQACTQCADKNCPCSARRSWGPSESNFSSFCACMSFFLFFFYVLWLPPTVEKPAWKLVGDSKFSSWEWMVVCLCLGCALPPFWQQVFLFVFFCGSTINHRINVFVKLFSCIWVVRLNDSGSRQICILVNTHISVLTAHPFFTLHVHFIPFQVKLRHASRCTLLSSLSQQCRQVDGLALLHRLILLWTYLTY